MTKRFEIWDDKAVNRPLNVTCSKSSFDLPFLAFTLTFLMLKEIIK